MSPWKAPDFLARILEMVLTPSLWIITLLAAGGFFLAVQSKIPIEMHLDSPNVSEDLPGLDTKTITYSPLIFDYKGPIVFTLSYNAFPEDTTMILYSGGAKLSTTVIKKDYEGEKSFFIYPEHFDPSTGVIVDIKKSATITLDELINHAKFSFPKSGVFLIPDLWMWIGFAAIALCFGLICSLLWNSSTNIIASYAATAVTLVLACHFGGIGLAMRISNKVFAVVLLLVVIILVRMFAMPKKAVVVQPK